MDLYIPLTREQLNRAGWFSIVDAFLAIPILVLGAVGDYLAKSGSGGGLKVLEVALTIVSLGLTVYVLVILRRLLNLGYQFHDVDTYISVLIVSSVLLVLLDLLLWDSAAETASAVLAAIAAVVLGIVMTVFAIRLMRLPEDLFGYLKGYCYATIATGFCMASIILAPLALVTGGVAAVILGMIFFKEAERS